MTAEPMTERFEMRLSQSVLERVDAWRARQSDFPSRSEGVRRLVELALAQMSGGEKDRQQIKIDDGQKLIVLMLCDILKALKARSEIEPEFLEEVIFGGHFWGLAWKYGGIFHGHEDSTAVVSSVVDILDMWNFLERGFSKLSKKDKDRLATEAAPLGKNIVFLGFDGNNESEYLHVAHFMINKLDRFSRFKGRDLDAHMPTMATHNRMLTAFRPMRTALAGRELNFAELVEIVNAELHPSNRASR